MTGECLDMDAESFSAGVPPMKISFGGEGRLTCLIVAVVVGAGIMPGID